MTYIEHIVSDNERWDMIAWLYYGSFSKVTDSDGNEINVLELLIRENEGIPIKAVIATGTVLRIPVIETTELQTSKMPPWKQ